MQRYDHSIAGRLENLHEDAMRELNELKEQLQTSKLTPEAKSNLINLEEFVDGFYAVFETAKGEESEAEEAAKTIKQLKEVLLEKLSPQELFDLKLNGLNLEEV